MLLYELPSGQLRRSFLQKLDDERLRAIISRYAHPPISQWEWHQIAAVFGRGVTVRQIPERWHDYARPGLDPGPFSISERGQVAALAIDHPRNWKWISTQLGNGEQRSATMVKQCGVRILPKLVEIGFEIETSSDIAFVPDAVFERGIPKGAVREALLAEFRANKARQAAPAAGDAEAAAAGRQFAATCPLDVEGLLAKPLPK
jgi:hypothetical protein